MPGNRSEAYPVATLRQPGGLLQVDAMRDPKILGVTLYMNMNAVMDDDAPPRPAGFSCHRSPAIFLAADLPQDEDLLLPAQGSSIFDHNTLQVKRVIDAKANAAVYVALSKDRFSAICSVHLDDGALTQS